MLKTETKDASTTTNLAGLHKPFGLLVNKSDAPTSIQQTQTTLIQKESTGV